MIDNKYLEKIAAGPGYSNMEKAMKTMHRRYYKEAMPSVVLGTAGGTAAGGALGYHDKTEEDYYTGKTVQKSTASRIWSGVKTGIGGGIIGAGLSAKFALPVKSSKKGNNPFKQARTFSNRARSGFYKKGPGGQSRATGGSEGYYGKGGGRSQSGAGYYDINDLQAELGFPPGGFKTKTEATKHYKGKAMKMHPDRGGNLEDMQKLSTAWKKFKDHPDGFEKLANLYLEKVAGWL